MSTVSFPTRSAEYHVVVPAPGKAAPYAAIKLELNPASLPAGIVGESFAGFDFNTALRITGDTDLDMSKVAWSVYSGSLPMGLSLTNEGGLYGMPTEMGESGFQVLAKYKTKTVLGGYSVETKTEHHITNNAGTRAWDNGEVAQSCLEYRQPTYPYMYAGDTGDGLYRIAPNDQAPFDAYCDMTSEGGGWTRVVRQTEAEPVTSWEGINGASYALVNGQIPSHTQTAFGKDEQATYVDYGNFTYTTGDITPAVVVTSPKTGRSFHIHRGIDRNHNMHNPEEFLSIRDYTGGNWLNTLTFDQIGGRHYTWAFSAYQSIRNARGYSMNGILDAIADSFAWTVWVR